MDSEMEALTEPNLAACVDDNEFAREEKNIA